MGKLWNKESIKIYEEAANFSQYPEVPLKGYFRDLIRPEDTVLEIGSGAGVVSLYIAPMCRKLISVDDDKNGCEHLKKRAAERGISNIEVHNHKWPDERLEQADVSITLYVYKLFNTKAMVRELLKSTERAGMIMTTQPGVKGGYPAALSKHLGMNLHKSVDYHDGIHTASLLEAEGVKVHCETVKHEFGQPVHSLDEATSFMMNHLKLSDYYFPKVRELAGELTEIRNKRLYVPYERTNSLILFEK